MEPECPPVCTPANFAAYCHALAQAVSDGLAHDVTGDVTTRGGKGGQKDSGQPARRLAERAKVWERQADHLVMQGRDHAQRQRRWLPFARLLELSPMRSKRLRT